MDWSQISVGAIAGSIITLVLQTVKSWIDHLLYERKQRSAEQRVVRAEQREEERKEGERKRADASTLEKDADTLEMFKTHVRGATDLTEAAKIVGLIHAFFIKNPQYVRVPANKAFLEMYPKDYYDQVCYDSDRFTASSLAILKNDVQSLKIR